MNINEIAKLSGVSRATVSRYLNKGYVSAEKRQLISDVIAKTGYVPSTYAQTLRTNRTGVIGIIVPKISSESVSRMVDGATALVSRQGLHPLLGNTSQDPEKEIEYLNVFQNRQVDGVLLIATILSPRLEKMLREYPVPVVVLGQETQACGCVCYDDFSAAKELTEAMIGRGRRTIGYIGVITEDRAAGLARLNGYKSALQSRSLPFRPELVTQGSFTAESGYENVARLLEKEQALDGLFCATDNIAAGAMVRLREKGYAIPQDVAVCGIGDSQIAKLLCPPLTSANLHYKTGGEEAARMLLGLMEGNTEVRKTIRLGCTLVIRDSFA